MSVFNMKQWLLENKKGPYAKTPTSNLEKIKSSIADGLSYNEAIEKVAEELEMDPDVLESECPIEELTTTDEQIGVGYVMKVKPSDPESKRF